LIRVPAAIVSPFAEMLEREVGATPEEYLRGLRSAFPAGEQTGPLEFAAVEHGTTLRISITPQPPRRIGGFDFPRLAVRLAFEGGDAAAQRAVLAHMDRMMLRGGG
jgi:hypothetical protein